MKSLVTWEELRKGYGSDCQNESFYRWVVYLMEEHQVTVGNEGIYLLTPRKKVAMDRENFR